MKKKKPRPLICLQIPGISYSNIPKYLNTVSDLLVLQRLLKYRKRNKSSKKASESYNDHYKKFASADYTTNFFNFFFTANLVYFNQVNAARGTICYY